MSLINIIIFNGILKYAAENALLQDEYNYYLNVIISDFPFMRLLVQKTRSHWTLCTSTIAYNRV